MLTSECGVRQRCSAGHATVNSGSMETSQHLFHDVTMTSDMWLDTLWAAAVSQLEQFAEMAMFAMALYHMTMKSASPSFSVRDGQYKNLKSPELM